jgi:hypothetical protein
MDDETQLELLKHNRFLRQLHEWMITVSEQQIEDWEALGRLNGIVSHLIDVVLKVSNDRADVRGDLVKLDEKLVALQEYLGDLHARPRPIPGKPPDLSVILGGRNDDKKS